MSFLIFMANPVGRGIRVIAGVVIAAIGLLVVGGTAGIAVAAVGGVVFLAGAINVCLFAPIAGGSFFGSKLPQG